jgi:orotate phosphoribosyltransferase
MDCVTGSEDAARELRRSVMRELYQNGLFRTWLNSRPEGWELVSGLWSPLYIQIRHLVSYPRLLDLVATAIAGAMREEAPEVNRIVGIASAGVPLATVLSQKTLIPMAYTRKLQGVRTIEDLERHPSEYAEHALVEGELADGDRIALIDDVTAMMTSKDVAIGQVGIEAARRHLTDVKVSRIVVVVDREQAAFDPARFQGAQLLPLIRLRSEGIKLLEGIASKRELEVIEQYLRDPHAFQDAGIRARLVAEAKEAVRQARPGP